MTEPSPQIPIDCEKYEEMYLHLNGQAYKLNLPPDVRFISMPRLIDGVPCVTCFGAAKDVIATMTMTREAANGIRQEA